MLTFIVKPSGSTVSIKWHGIKQLDNGFTPGYFLF